MGKVLALANQKGGVGKTTTTVNLSASLTMTKRKVLLVDLDPQGNATMGCGLDKHSLEWSINDVLLDRVELAKAILYSEKSRFDVLPANGDLTQAEVLLMKQDRRECRLRSLLDEIQTIYDFILIDCPPALNMLTINALVAAEGVIIPVQCEYYALEGLAALLDTIERIKTVSNSKLVIEGLLRTMFDPRNNLSNDVSRQLLKHFGSQVFRTVIPRNVRLAEAPSYGIPILEYDSKSAGALAYLALASEVLSRK